MSNKKEIAAITTAAEGCTLLPKLRFPEFQGKKGWESKSLIDVCLRITNGKANAEDHEENGIYPLYDRSEVIKRSSKFAYDDEAIIIPGEGVRFQPKYYKGKFNLHQRAYALMQHQCDARFVYYSMDRFQSILAKKAVKSTVLSLRLPILEQFRIPTTNNAEQQKIADCFTSIDELITLESQKLDALKRHKKGLMQQLFPAESEAVPRLRFPESQKAGEWEAKTLAELAENLDNRRIPVTEKDRIKGKIPYYGASGIVDYIHDFIFDEDLLCISEDGANLVARTTPIAFPISGKTWVNNHAHVLKFEHRCTQKIVEDYLNSISLEDYLTGMAQPKLNRAMLDTIPVPTPRDRDEQQKIADCLTSLDDRITSQTQKIESLKTHKKGLMQQLFPTMGEV